MSSYQSLVDFAKGISHSVILEAPATEGVILTRSPRNGVVSVQVKGSKTVYTYRPFPSRDSRESLLVSPSGRKMTLSSARIPYGLREALLFLDSAYFAQRSGDFSELLVGSAVLHPKDMKSIVNHAKVLKDTLNSMPPHTSFDTSRGGASLAVGLPTRGVTFEFTGSSPNIVVNVLNNGEIVRTV